MKKFLFTITIIWGCAISTIHAQDAQFSQMEDLSQVFNPATTGIFNQNDISIAAAYRNQWSSLSSSINSFLLSFELPPINKRWGLGAYLKNTDEIGLINTFSFIASGSYIITDPRNTKYLLSAGLQVGFIYKRINIDNMTFDQQYEAGNFNPDLANGENFIRQNTWMPDVNIGFYYRNVNKENVFRPYGGFSVYHITYPKEQFLDGTIDHLPLRYFAQLGASYDLNDLFNLSPNVYYQRQREFQQFLFNVLGSYTIHKSPYKVIAGLGYRTQDAVIMYLGIQHGLNIFRFSYDFNVSGLKTYTRNRGAIEFSLIYRAGNIKKRSVNRF